MDIYSEQNFSNGGCDASFSNAATLTVLLTPTVSIDPIANQTVCRVLTLTRLILPVPMLPHIIG
jgi:hypothetical protein